MKAKISELDPTGVEVKSKVFYFPFIKKNLIQLIKLKDGTVLRGEPMRQVRYLLEIEEFKYFVKRNGDIIKIEGYE